MLRLDDKFLRAAAVALTVLVPAALVVATPTTPALAQSGPDGEVDHETFYRELSPYGKWFEHARWGEVWRPDVESGWRPYTRGHWAWTDEHGWYWVAEEEWGWAPFHYGRWVFDDDEEEWLWIPGTEWAPAWVQWRESDDAIGWAPLPPASLLDGSSLRHEQTYYDSPRFSRYWVFAPPALMIAPGLYRHIYPVSRHSTFLRSTRHVSLNHRFDRGRIYLPGIDHRRFERITGRSLPVVTLRPVGSPRDYGWRRMQDRTTVPVYRPRVIVRQDAQRQERPMFGGADRNRDGVPDWRQDRNRDGVPDWRQDRNRDGRPRIATPEPPRDRNRDGIPDGQQDRNRDNNRPGIVRPDGRRIYTPEQDREAGGRIRPWDGRPGGGGVVTPGGGGGDAARRAQEQQNQQQRQQQDAARRAQEQQSQRQQQDAARKAQEEQARRTQEQNRQQQEAARRQQDQARQQADAARKAQEEAARRQQQQRSGQPPSGQPQSGQPPQGGRGEGRGGEGRRRDGEGRRRDDQEPKQRNN